MSSSLLALALLAVPQSQALVGSGPTRPLPALLPMDVHWNEYGGGRACGATYTPGGERLPNLGFVELAVGGDVSHVGVWVQFVAEFWVDRRFFDDEQVPPYYQVLAPELSAHAGSSVNPNMPPCILKQAELDRILASALVPGDPDAVKDAFQPVFWPLAGTATRRVWDATHAFRNPQTAEYWSELHTAQVPTALRFWPWVLQRLVDQTASSANPLNYESASNLLLTQIDKLEEYGFGMRIQAIMLWDNDPEIESFRERSGVVPGLTGSVVGIGTTTPLEYTVVLGQNNLDSQVQRDYPTVNIPQEVYPITRWSRVRPGQRVHFDMCGHVGQTFARIVVNGDEGDPWILPVQRQSDLLGASLVAPAELPAGSHCSIAGFIAHGVVGPTIPSRFRDVFEIHLPQPTNPRPAGLRPGGTR